MARKRHAAPEQQKIALTIHGKIVRSHEEDGITVIDEIELTSIGGIATDWLIHAARSGAVKVDERGITATAPFDPAGRRES